MHVQWYGIALVPCIGMDLINLKLKQMIGATRDPGIVIECELKFKKL